MIAWPMALAVAWLTAASYPAAGPQDKIIDRIYLKNGSSLDGHITRRGDKDIDIDVRSGVITVALKNIRRIEKVLIRSKRAKPAAKEKPVEPPPPKKPVLKPAPKKPEPKPPPKETSVDIIHREVDALLALLDRLKKPEDRKRVVKSLEKLDEPGLVHLAGRLEKLDGPARKDVVTALSNAKPAKAVPVLIGLLRGRDAGVRGSAVEILQAIVRPPDARSLRFLLRDRRPEVCLAAVSILDSLGDKDSFHTIAPLCKSKNADLRRRSLLALMSLSKRHKQGEQLVKQFLIFLDSTRGDVRADLTAALAKLRLKHTWKEFVELLNAPEPQVRAQAALALGNLGVAGAKAPLADQMSVERNRITKVQLAWASGKLKSRNGVNTLVEWTRDGDAGVRNAAFASLRKITGQKIGNDASQWESWRQEQSPKAEKSRK